MTRTLVALLLGIAASTAALAADLRVGMIGLDTSHVVQYLNHLNDPQFKDYVLYLKHNLNAQAIASLKGEAMNIQAEITKLIAQMNQSIAKADEFVKTLQ